MSTYPVISGSSPAARRLRGASVLALVLTALLGAVTSPASAFERQPGVNVPTTGGLVTGPVRTTLSVKPGEHRTIQMYVLNKTGEVADVGVEPVDADASSDPSSLVRVTGRSEFGASDWIKLERPAFMMQPGETIRQIATVRVPASASPGSHYAVIVVSRNFPKPKRPGSASVTAHFEIALEVFVDVAGPVVNSGKLVASSVDPTVIAGPSRFVGVHYTYENTGTSTGRLMGTVTFRSLFGANAKQLRAPGQLVLRGGRRETDLLWRNVPWIGRFTPHLHIDRGRGVAPLDATLPAVWVVPPWYFDLAAVIAILVPIFVLARRRRAWRRHLESADGEDEDDFDDGAGDYD